MLLSRFEEYEIAGIFDRISWSFTFSSFKGSFNIMAAEFIGAFREEDRFAVRDPILRREYNYSPSIFLAPLPIYPI